MSKHSKKRKRKKSSSTSSDNDEKVSKRQDDTYHRKTVRRKESVRGCESCRKEHHKSVKTDSRSSHHIKKPVYTRPKTPPAEKKATHKEEQCTKTRSVSAISHGERISSETKRHRSGKDKTISGSESAERRPSKSLTPRTVASVPQTEKTSKDRSDKKLSHGSQTRLKRKQMSPSSNVSKQESHTQVVRKKCSPEESKKNGNDVSTIKALETVSSSPKDSPQQKNRELEKNLNQSSAVTEPEAKKSLCTDPKTHSASITEKPSSSTKHATSENSSKELLNVISASKKDTPVSRQTVQASSILQLYSQKFVPFKFKIPKKVRPIPSHFAAKASENRDTVPTTINLKKEKKVSHSESLLKKIEQEVIQPAGICLSGTPNFQSGRQNKESLSGQPLPADNTTEPQNDQIQVVEQLNLARSEEKLELTQSYGELTCMDIDSPEDGPTHPCSRQHDQQDLILILDTNILLSHLDYVKKIISHGLGALGSPVVLIPWVVLQELDSLKKGRGLSGSVAHLATPAISYIYNALKNGEPRLWGQSMQQAAESSYGLNAENNDDRVLQCCLQYRNMHPECSLILCTNDKNLCSKALLSGVRALCKSDLEAEVKRSVHGLHILPHTSPQISSPALKRSSTPAQSHTQEGGCPVGVLEKDTVCMLNSDGKQLSKGVSVGAKWNRCLSICLSELEECLRQVLSDVLEAEMKAAFQELWLEIVHIKPPWTLQDVLQCLKKHWIAVFGQIAPRRNLETVLNLIKFFNSGKSVDGPATSAAIHEAKDLVKAFWKSSNHVAHAISVMESIFNRLQPEQQLCGEEESFACDVVMNDDDEDKRLMAAQVYHQEMWTLFENVWSNLYQTSLEVFKALSFDPRTMCRSPAVGAPLPPQDALACLHKLSSVVSQLLQAFSSVLSSAPGLQEVQALLSIMHFNKIVNEDSRLTAKDLLDCFSQPDYREKLRVGGSQLMELKEALDRCIQATDQHVNQSSHQ